MNPELRKAALLLLAIVLVVGLIVVFLYARQRLFTRSEPIVLSS